jgi:hypothetical protein
MSAKHITSGEFVRIKRALKSAQYHHGELTRAKKLLLSLMPEQPGGWSSIDLAVISRESPRALISRCGLRLKNK